MADIGANAGGLLQPRWVDTAPWVPPAFAGRTRDAGPSHRHPLAFTGSGSEYFRIWIVNLVATLLTLGFYYPWARVRRLCYFHNNTRLGGRAFDFHGRPRRMLRGFLLVWLLLAVYNFASGVSTLGAAIGLVTMTALWPALWRASLRFRLGHTSWSGMRFAFEGSAAGAYRAFVGPVVVAVTALLLLTAGLDGGADDRPDPGALVWRLLAFVGLLLGAAPAAWHALKRYQHDHYAIADRRSEWRATRREVYGVLARSAALAVAAFATIGGLGALVLFGTRDASGGAAGPLLAVLPSLAAFAVLHALPGAYLQSRMQNLVWGRTVASGLHFDSRLAFVPLLRLRLKNALWLALTLGLYWPWAAVATARLRLSAVTVLSDEPLDRLVGALHAASPDASGDAAADLVGVDFGL